MLGDEYFKTECYAYREFGNCIALKKIDCDECEFFKSRETFYKELKLSTLTDAIEIIGIKIAKYHKDLTLDNLSKKEKYYIRRKIAEYQEKKKNYEKWIELKKGHKNESIH